jgi:hypothetical protein
MAFDVGDHMPALVLAILAAILAFAFGVIVLRAGEGARVNRRLAILLFADGLFALGSAASTLIEVDAASAARVWIGAPVLLDALAQLAFIATLDTPLARPLRGRSGWFVTGSLGVVALGFTLAGAVRGSSLMSFGNIEGPCWILLALVSVIALVISLDAYRRTERGSVAHRRSGAAATAFVARDVVAAFTVGAWATGDINHIDALKVLAEASGGFSIILFVALLTYGIMRTQLFDIDLKIRWGIQKGTIVGVVVAAAFVGEKIAENYLSRAYGWIIGSVVAGLLVFAAPRLNKLGDKVAQTALPKVEMTPSYLHFKKLEVYKAAVESALEDDQVIDPKERQMLDRLRAKLALTEADAMAIETELAPS